MLQSLNERIQGMIAWIIIILVTLTFALFGLDYYMGSHQDAEAAAEVNGEPILKQTQMLNERRARHMQENSENISEKELKQEVMERLIQQVVLLQAAKNNGFKVSPAEANAAILRIPQFQTDGHFSTERYAEALNGALFTKASFQEEVRQGMILNQQRFAWMGTAFTLPDEISQFARISLQTRDYEYMQIPAAQFLKTADISDAAIEAYYKKHQKRFLTPEQVSLDYIQLSMTYFKNAMHVSLASMRNYYSDSQMKQPFDEVKASIEEQIKTERAEQQFTKVLDALSDLSYQTPDSLAPVAKELHLPLQHTELFSAQGGNTELTKNKRVLQAAFSQEVLQFENNSAPITIADQNVIVLRVHQRLPASIKPLSEVKDLIKNELAKVQSAEKAQQIGLLVIKNQPVPEIEASAWKVIKNAHKETNNVLFDINNLAFQLSTQDNKRGLQLANGDYVVVHLLAYHPGDETQLNKEQRAMLRQQLESNQGAMDYTLYVNALMRQAKINKTTN